MNGKAIALFVVAVSFVLLFVRLGTGDRREPSSTARTRPAATVPPEPQVSAPGTEGSVPRVAAATLREQLERGELVVIDVRDIDSYVTAHIPGAMHIPLSYIESELPYLPRSKPMVTYCT